MKFDQAVWTYQPTKAVKDLQAKYVEDLPQEQRTKIEQLRKRTEDVLQPKHNDFYLVRWLRARKWDITAAENMLRAHLKWREEWRVDYMYEEFQPTEMMLKYVTFGVSGEDAEGSPLLIIPLGNYDVVGVVSSADVKNMIKYYMYCFEYAEKLTLTQTEKHGKVISNHSGIIDMENFRFKDWIYKPAYDLLIQFMQVFEANYPEIVKIVFMINVSKIFRIFFAMIKPFFCEETRNKFLLYGNENVWKPKVLKIVDPKQLPVYWGGEMVDEVDQNPYCSSKIGMGGKIPQSYYACTNRVASTDNDLHTVTINRRDNLALDIDVPEAGSTLSWTFWTEKYDIGFGLNKGTCSLLSSRRFDCALTPEKGEMKCEEPGIYSLVFDNSFSLYRSKKVSYEVQVTPEETQISIGEGIVDRTG